MKKFKQENGGFTLIELVVVMIIIGILVLLATPRFIKYVREARYTNIINDIRTVETVSIPDMAKNNSFPKGTSKLSIRDFSDVIVERKLYAKDGYINQNQEDDFTPEVGRLSETYGDNLSKFYLLDKKAFVKPETRTRLKGDFFINKNGDVLYVDDRGEFAEDAFDVSNMYLYDSSNPGKVVGINKESLLWETVNRKKNPSYNPAFEGLSYEEVNWNEIVSEEDFQEYKGFYEGKGMTLEDVRKTIYEVGREQYMMEFPGIPATKKTENNDRVDVTEIQDKAFMNVLFYGGFSGKNLEKIGNLAFFSSNFTGKFKQDKLETIGDLAFAGSNFTGELFAPSLKSIGYGGLQNSNFTGDFNAENLEILGDYALASSEFKVKFNAPNLKSIGEYNLYRSKFIGDYNTNLKYITRETLGDINLNGFDGSFNAPKAVVIAYEVFKNAKFTGDFNAPNVVSIGAESFYSSEFSGKFNAPKVKEIGGNAFEKSSFTGNFIAPDIELVGDYSFRKSKFGGSIDLPNAYFIGWNAFEESNFTGDFKAMNNLVTFDEKLARIKEVLKDDDLPKEMREQIKAGLKEIDDDYEANKEEYEDKVFKVRESAFKNSEFMGSFDSLYIERIGENAFEGSKFTGNLNLPEVKYIGENAFKNSEFTGNLNLPEVEYIGDNAFMNSKFIGDLKLPKLGRVFGDAFKNSKFTGELNVPKIEIVGKGEYKDLGYGRSTYLGINSAFGDNPQFSSYSPNNQEMINAIKSNKYWRKDGDYVEK